MTTPDPKALLDKAMSAAIQHVVGGPSATAWLYIDVDDRTQIRCAFRRAMADALATLQAERDQLREDNALAVEEQNKAVDRAEKAEASLAAALQERDAAIASYEAAVTPTERPEAGERLLLNAYGRACFDSGRRSALQAQERMREALKGRAAWAVELGHDERLRSLYVRGMSVGYWFRDLGREIEAALAPPVSGGET